jgi:hypothetical protein
MPVLPHRFLSPGRISYGRPITCNHFPARLEHSFHLPAENRQG